MTYTEEYQARTRESLKRHERALEVFPGGVSHNTRYWSPYPIYIDRTEGAHLWDVDGNRYLDFWMNHHLSLLGHAYPDVVDAVAEQVREGLHYGAVNQLALDLGREVLAYFPSAERLRFCVTGTEATMYAVRLARAATGRRRIMKVAGDWHGGNTDLSKAVFGPLDEPTTGGLPPGAAEHVHAFELNDQDTVLDLLDAYPDEFAGVILDPWRHGITPEAEFLSFLEDVREDYGVLLLLDEIVSGFRISPGSYQARAGVEPDLTAFGKVAGGGLPLGGLAGRAELFEPARPDATVAPDERVLAGGGTFSAHPLTMAAGLATLEVLQREPVHEYTESRGERVRTELQAAIDESGIGGTVLGISSQFTPAFNPEKKLRSPRDVVEATDRELLLAFHKRLFGRGYYFKPGSAGNVSFQTTDEQLDGFIDAAREVLAELDESA